MPAGRGRDGHRQVALEVHVDRARNVARAPGSEPRIGLAELEAAVGDEPAGVGQPAASSRVEMSGVCNLFSARRILPAMDERHAMLRQREDEGREPRGRLPLPLVTNDEREFWRRAVAAERRRQRCGRPAPFPFQPA